MAATPDTMQQAPRRGIVDWRAVLRQAALSRALDDIEESKLVPERKVLYQFSARGHEITQVLMGKQLSFARDAVAGYYRSRPLLLTLGLTVEQALASSTMHAGGMSEGRDIGVVFNLPRRDGACALPVCGGVGTQYTPAVGWAQALRYRERVLGDQRCAGSIAVAHGGDASTATNGFWAALNIVTTERLPFLFFIEDNGYGISVPSGLQTPGGNIARNLAAFGGLPMAFFAFDIEPGNGPGGSNCNGSSSAIVPVTTAEVAAVKADGIKPVIYSFSNGWQGGDGFTSVPLWVSQDNSSVTLKNWQPGLAPFSPAFGGWTQADVMAVQDVYLEYDGVWVDLDSVSANY